MSEQSGREEIRQIILTEYRPTFEGILENMLRAFSLPLDEAVEMLQLGVIYRYEEAKQKTESEPSLLLEWQEIAVLELIASIGRDRVR